MTDLLCRHCQRPLTEAGFCTICDYGWDPDDSHESFGRQPGMPPSMPYTEDRRVDLIHAVDQVPHTELEEIIAWEGNLAGGVMHVRITVKQGDKELHTFRLPLASREARQHLHGLLQFETLMNALTPWRWHLSLETDAGDSVGPVNTPPREDTHGD